MKNMKKRDAQKDNMLITLIMWVFLACIGMGAMLYVASQKTIVIADTVPGGKDYAEMNSGDYGLGTTELLFESVAGEAGRLHIPLQKGMKAEKIVMENHYLEREFWIYLQGAEKEFYEENAILGDVAPVIGGYCEMQQGSLVLKLRMEKVFEYQSTMENNALVIACYEPHELYEQIVVVDPMGGGSESGAKVGLHTEKEIAMQVAKQLQKQPTSESIKIYYTRLEDETVSREERLALIEAVKADLFISICSCVDTEHPEYYGVHGYYNDEYYIPEYGNIQWADILTRNVTIAASNRAIGLTPAKEGSILYDVEIPAAEICVGYMSNKDELALLGREAYQEKLAKGLKNAIEEFFTLQNTEREVKEDE